MQLQPEDWQSLSVPERIELVEEIWDSVARDVERLPVTDAQLVIVRERLAAYRRDPSRVLSWDEVRKGLRPGQ